MITTQNITKRFGGVVALEEVSVAFNERICGLIGPNGAGKTTLLNVFSGFIPVTNGQILINSTDVTHLKPAARARLGLRRVFQHERINEDLSLRDNVRAVADHLAGPGSQPSVDDIIALFDLTDHAHTPGAALNLFQRRMTEIARTLIGDVSVILLDEPGAGLDEAESQLLRRAIRLIVERTDAQVILIDHDPHLIADLCAETLVLDFGRILAMGPTREVLDRKSVREAYLGVTDDDQPAVN